MKRAAPMKLETNEVCQEWARGAVVYNPQWRIGDEIVTAGESAQSDYYKYDALFTMWITPECDNGEMIGDEFNIDKRLAALINERFNKELDVVVLYNTLPSWTMIRDRATQLTGVAVHNVDLFVRHLKDISYDTVYLDASTFHDKDPEINSFGRLVELAANTKVIVEDYLADNLNARATIDFLNAEPGGIVSFMGSETTKWLAEGEILNKELIKIPAFQKNFNRIVITGIPKAVGKGGLNMNQIYQLLAKLGRINTKILLLD